MFKFKGSSKNCQADSALSLAETSTRGSAGEFSEGVQALITCTPQIATLSCIYSGIDTLHLSLYADLTGSPILEEIEKARAVAREYEQECIPFTYFSPQWNVHRAGRRQYTYHLSMADTHVFFNTRSVDGNFPTCLIEIGSMSSHHPGAFEVYNEILKYFSSCDISIRKHHVTRVDLSTDFVNISFAGLDLHNMEKWITRANSSSVHYSGRTVSGMSMGKGNLMCRIYAKRTELNVKRATAKADFFNRMWGLMADDRETPVTRVEFQLRREVLKEMHDQGDMERIETIEDLQKSLDGLWSYCSKVWVRHTNDEIDRANNHQSRSKSSPFWILVQSVTFTKDNPNLWRTRKVKDYINIEPLIEQGVGCLVTAVAAGIETMDDFRSVATLASDIVRKALRFRLDFREEQIREKMQIAFNKNRLQPAGLPVF